MVRTEKQHDKRAAGRILAALFLGWVGLFLFGSLTVPVAAGPIPHNPIVDVHKEYRQGDSYLEVYDLRGRLLFEMQGRLGEPRVMSLFRRLPVGVYLVRVLTPNEQGQLSISVKKIVLLR